MQAEEGASAYRRLCVVGVVGYFGGRLSQAESVCFSPVERICGPTDWDSVESVLGDFVPAAACPMSDPVARRVVRLAVKQAGTGGCAAIRPLLVPSTMSPPKRVEALSKSPPLWERRMLGGRV